MRTLLLLVAAACSKFECAVLNGCGYAGVALFFSSSFFLSYAGNLYRFVFQVILFVNNACTLLSLCGDHYFAL